jgi:hypothetical protein
MNLPKLQILMPWDVGGFPVWSSTFQVSVPSPQELAWDARSMTHPTHPEIQFPMH